MRQRRPVLGELPRNSPLRQRAKAATTAKPEVEESHNASRTLQAWWAKLRDGFSDGLKVKGTVPTAKAPCTACAARHARVLELARAEHVLELRKAELRFKRELEAQKIAAEHRWEGVLHAARQEHAAALAAARSEQAKRTPSRCRSAVRAQQVEVERLQHALEVAEQRQAAQVSQHELERAMLVQRLRTAHGVAQDAQRLAATASARAAKAEEQAQAYQHQRLRPASSSSPRQAAEQVEVLAAAVAKAVAADSAGMLKRHLTTQATLLRDMQASLESLATAARAAAAGEVAEKNNMQSAVERMHGDVVAFRDAWTQDRAERRGRRSRAEEKQREAAKTNEEQEIEALRKDLARARAARSVALETTPDRYRHLRSERDVLATQVAQMKSRFAAAAKRARDIEEKTSAATRRRSWGVAAPTGEAERRAVARRKKKIEKTAPETTETTCTETGVSGSSPSTARPPPPPPPPPPASAAAALTSSDAVLIDRRHDSRRRRRKRLEAETHRTAAEARRRRRQQQQSVLL